MTSPGRRAPAKKTGESVPAQRYGTDQGPESERSHRAFLANLRAGLRMPVNAIIEYSAMLLEDAREQGQESFIQDLMKIHALGKDLLALVDGGLDESRIDTAWTEKEFED